jgi:hypothetical protein
VSFPLLPAAAISDGFDVSGWRPAWREMAASDEIRTLEAELEEAEGRILEDLAADPAAGRMSPRPEASPAPPPAGSQSAFQPAAQPAAEPVAQPPAQRRGFRPGGVVDRVVDIIDQTLTIPRGQGAARVVGDQALFGVALSIEQARTLLDAWVDLMESDDAGDGSPPSPEVVALSEFLFVLLQPLAERLSELP